MKYLTKSRFKVGLECPTKLFYLGKDEYPSNKVDNPFLQSLANGGFQVGALAQCYFPFGYTVTERDQHLAVVRTNELLKKPRVTIYEAAFMHGNLFVRVDILVKRGNEVELIEVKSKTIDSNDEKNFTHKIEISADWKEHIFDVAFQKYVINQAKKELNVSSFLCLVDKSKTATVNALHQKFYIERDEENQMKVRRSGKFNKDTLGEKVLVKIPVDDYVQRILDGTDKYAPEPLANTIDFMLDVLKAQEKETPIRKAACGTCEYRCGAQIHTGFAQCWTGDGQITPADLNKPLTLDLWAQFMGTRKQQLIKNEKYFFEDLTIEDIEPLSSKDLKNVVGLTSTERRVMQIEKALSDDARPYLDRKAMRKEMASWQYPLHFIDFETTAVALPFHAGRRPYEQIAFQFSHHIVEANGAVRHANQWIATEVGEFPNFAFVRELRRCLGVTGTIFKYASHENSILVTIADQLMDSDEADKAELITFIETITHSKANSSVVWKGDRDMVDMCDLVRKLYYHPHTKGKNSIKNVLEAILVTSPFLNKKYGKATYGTKAMPSLNFKKKKWIVKPEGVVVNPYTLLPKLFDEVDEQYLLSHSDELKDGGAAMTAYARMQYTRMSEDERQAIIQGLYNYCELDTLAMVMLYEEWQYLCR